MRSRSAVLSLAVVVAVIASTAVFTYPFRERPDYQVGPQPDGSLVVPTDQRVTPAGTQIDFAGRPFAVAVRPDQQTAAVLNVGGGNLTSRPIIVVDLATGTIKQQFAPGTANGSYDGILYSADGAHLYFSQDNRRVVVTNVAADGTLTLAGTIVIPSALGTVNNGGLALSSDGSTLYVVLNQANRVGIINLATSQFAGTIAVENAPKSIVVVGNSAYVTNQGGRLAQAGDFTAKSAGADIVADPQSAAAMTGTVSVIDLQTNSVIKNIRVGLQPTAILAANDLVYVANSNSDSVSVIDPVSYKVIHTQNIKPFHRAPFGSSPNGLALTSRNQLAVTLGANNAVALYRWNHNQHKLMLEGFIPTAWYPSDVATVAARSASQSGTGSALPERLIVVNTKGTAVGANVPNTGTPGGKNTHTYLGSVSIIPLPEPSELAAYSAQVAENNGWNHRSDEGDQPQPFTAGHPIEHVIYVIKENRTYDQVLADDPRGTRDMSLLQFGATVTPNQHALAEQFALFDNFYDSGVLSADGHQWVMQAFAPDYIEKGFTDFNRSYPFNGGDSLVYSPTGFLWMNAAAHGRSVRVYGEYIPRFAGPAGQPFGSWSDWYRDSQILEGRATGTLHAPLGTFQAVADVPSLQAVLNPDYPTYNTGIPDQYRLDIFLREFEQYVRNNNLPNLIIMMLCDDHTSGSSRGYPTPAAQVADNDLAVGRLVDAVSHSPYWASTALFFVEDDSQAGLDHVDGHRSTAFIASPYIRRGQVNHHYYTQIGMVRTIEDLLGLPPMNQHDKLAASMTDAFGNAADLTPFAVIPNQVALDTLNGVAVAGLQREWQLAIEKYFPHGANQEPDIADPNLLDHAIWYAVSNFTKPFPGEERILHPNEVRRSETRDRDGH